MDEDYFLANIFSFFPGQIKLKFQTCLSQPVVELVSILGLTLYDSIGILTLHLKLFIAWEFYDKNAQKFYLLMGRNINKCTGVKFIYFYSICKALLI